jgi:hypothetical protein
MKKLLSILGLLFFPALAFSQATITPNAGFQLPAYQQTNWQVPIDYNFTILDTIVGGSQTLVAATATPNITTASNWVTQNTASVTLTNFMNGFPGQTIRVICGGGDIFTTIAGSANISVTTPWSCASSGSISLTNLNGVWTETARAGGGGSAGLADPGANGIVYRNALNTTTIATLANLTALGAVPNTLTINGHTLTGNITLIYPDFAAGSIANGTVATTQPNGDNSTKLATDAFVLAQGFITGGPYVPTSTQVNGNALTGNIQVSASQITTGTLPHAQLPALISSDIPNNAANTSGQSGTALVLAATPSICTSGQAAQGVLANGNATGCFTPSSGGSPSVGPQYAAQCAGLASAFDDCSGVPFNVLGNFHGIGPNPNLDATLYGVREINPNSTPYLPGITATIGASSTSATVSSASTFQVGDGVLVIGAGAACGVGSVPAISITPSLAAGSPGSLIDVNSTAASTSYTYWVAWRDKNGCMSAAVSAATSTGVATLGPNHVTLTSATSSQNTVTWTTSGAHALVVNAEVMIVGTSDDKHFGGKYWVTSVPDSLHFTLLRGTTTAAGTLSTTATGGTVYWFAANKVNLGTPPTNATQAYIWKGAVQGTAAFVGVSLPVATNLSPSDPGYSSWDDFGYTAPTVPFWYPAHPPSSATNDNLSTTITNISGTTFTLANAAVTGVTSAAFVFDNEPNIQSVITAAASTGGIVNFPAPVTINYVYGTHAYMNLAPSGTVSVQQLGQIYLGDTMQWNSNIVSWNGVTTSRSVSCVQFDIVCTPIMSLVGANPGIYSTRGVLPSNMTILSNGNSYVGIYGSPSGIPIGVSDRLSFTSSAGNSDTNGIGLYMWADEFSGAAGMKISNLFTNTGPNQANGITDTPAIVMKGVGEVTIDCQMMNRRGWFLSPSVEGFEFTYNTCFENQGEITPQFSVFQNLDCYAGYLNIRGPILDTGGWPLLSIYASNFCGMTTISAASSAGSMPLVSGPPLMSLVLDDYAGGAANADNIGQNMGSHSWTTGCMLDGVYSTASACIYTSIEQFTRPISLNPATAIFFPNVAAGACTATLSAGGSLPIGSFTYSISPAFFGNRVGITSGTCTATTTSGNQTIIVVGPSVPGAVGYVPIQNGFIDYSGTSPCQTPASVTPSFVSANAFHCGPGAPSIPAGGPVEITANGFSVPTTNFVPLAAYPGLNTAGVEVYNLSSQNWLSFTPANSTSIYLTGAFLSTLSPTNGDCVSWIVSGGVTRLGDAGACGGGSITYPPSGIPNSTGSSWGSSYGTSGSGSTLCLTTGCSLSAPAITGAATAATINGTVVPTNATLTQIIAKGTAIIPISTISANTCGSAITVTAPNVSAFYTWSINSGGSSYVVGDVLTVVQGGGGSGQVRVTAVAGGVITQVTLVSIGTGYTQATNLSTTGGTGTGATVNTQGDNISADFSSDPTGIAGWAPTGSLLTIYKYPGTNTVNFKACNYTSSAITPGSQIVMNFEVPR